MRYNLLTSSLLACLLSSTATAQSPASGGARPSRITTLIGAGNSFSGIGVLADIRPFDRGPFSVMLSVGSTRRFFDVRQPSEPWVDQATASLTAAVGVRATAGRGSHQGFVELAFLPVDDDVVEVSAARSRIELLYGLGLQLGYRLRVTPAITVNALGGGGYALNKNVMAGRWKPLFGFGIGYAWR